MARPYRLQDKKELDKLTDKYSDEEIHLLTGISRWAVTNARKKLEVRSYFEKHGLKKDQNTGDPTYGGRKRQYDFDQHFFSELVSEPQAYYLGLLFADGSVFSGNKTEITLQEQDVHILEAFRVCLGHSPPLSYRPFETRKNCYRLTFCSKKMYDDLQSWGITPAKTHTLELKRQIPNHLKTHFIRGFWDGDGYIGKTDFNALIASESFLEQLNLLIYESMGFYLKKRWAIRGDRKYPILCKTRGTEVFVRTLYQNSTYHLRRKYLRFSRYWLKY